MPSLLELQDLYTESLTREIIEKTKGGGIIWNHVGGNQFNATSAGWGYYLTKTQIGNMSYIYSLDVKKDGITYLTSTSGPLTYSSRDSVVKELYEIVEIIVLELNVKVKEAIQYVQELPTALTTGIL